MTVVPSPLRFAREGSTARLTLTRPDVANAINLEMAQSLVSETARLAAEPPRVLIIDAEGPIFCAGGDVREMAESDNITAYLQELAETLHTALLTLSELDAVTIAAVGGAAAGAGLGLVLSADVVIASERARFLTAYEKLGVTPDGGVSYRLPRVIGRARALSMSVLSRSLDAETARDWGLVARVVAADELTAAADELAASLATRATAPLAATRRLISKGETATLAEQLDAEASGIARAAAHPHVQASIRAFASPPPSGPSGASA